MNNKKETELKKIIARYCEDIESGKAVVNIERKQMIERFRSFESREDLYIDYHEAAKQIDVIEKFLKHRKGETLAGEGLLDKPLLLLPWQKFIVLNLFGVKVKKTNLLLFKEAYIYVARKNGKTVLAAALAFAFSLKTLDSGSTTLIASSVLEQALQSFHFLSENLTAKRLGKTNVILKDNNHGHELKYRIGSKWATIKAVVPKDSLNANFVIFDELHLAKKAADYTIMKDATKAYTQKMVVGITTSGANIHHFNYEHLKQQQRVLAGNEVNDSMFIFIAKADEQGERTNEDYILDAREHEKANPSWKVTIRPDDMMNSAKTALTNPLALSEFRCKSLNLYTQDQRAYFVKEEIEDSDIKCSDIKLTDPELKKLDWFGGADLSKMHDLTAAALVAKMGDVQLIIGHGFFPRPLAEQRQVEHKALPFTWWSDKGWMTLSETPVVSVQTVVDWFVMMNKAGFKIKQIGFDRKFSEDFYKLMKAKHFKIVEENQTALNKSQGFREIERNIKAGKLRYFGNKLWQYCIENVRGDEEIDDVIRYRKVDHNSNIDVFDASVFATVRMLRGGAVKREIDDLLKGFN